MTYEVYYDRKTSLRWAYCINTNGDHLANAVFANKRGDCLAALVGARL